MDIGVMIPHGIPGFGGSRVLDWARRAEESEAFSTLALPDRIAYWTLDPLVALAAIAATTSKVRLMTNVVLPGTRNPVAFAKSVATLATFAPGRLTVGVGIGGRQEDYTVTGVAWTGRGNALDAALEVLHGLRERSEPLQSVGPELAGDVDVVIGGASQRAVGRILKYGTGYTHGGVQPWVFGLEAHGVREAWKASGRPGAPRILASTWVASTPEVAARAETWMADYMVQGGPPLPVRDKVHVGTDAVRGLVELFASYGAQEVVLTPCVEDPAELEWLVEVAQAVRDVVPAAVPEVPVPPAEVLAAMGGVAGGPPPGMGKLFDDAPA